MREDIPVNFFSDESGSRIFSGAGLSSCHLYGTNFQVGVNLRKRLAFMIFNPTPKYFGEFKLAPYDWCSVGQLVAESSPFSPFSSNFATILTI